MITRTYSYTAPFIDHDVIHLFEHLILRTFLKRLNAHGYTRSLIGWVNGETTDNTLKFDLGVYTPEIITLFEANLKDLERFEEDDIHNCLLNVSAEMREEAVITDSIELAHQLGELLSIIRAESTETTAAKVAPFSFRKNPNTFHTQEFIVKLSPKRRDDRVLFFALYPIIIDILRDALSNEIAYPLGTSPLVAHDEEVGVIWQLSLGKAIDVQTVAATMRDLLIKFDIGEHASEKEAYFHSYLRDEVFLNVTEDYERQTNTKTTRDEIFRLASVTNIARVFHMVSIEPTSLSKIERNGLGLE